MVRRRARREGSGWEGKRRSLEQGSKYTRGGRNEREGKSGGEWRLERLRACGVEPGGDGEYKRGGRVRGMGEGEREGKD